MPKIAWIAILSYLLAMGLVGKMETDDALAAQIIFTDPVQPACDTDMDCVMLYGFDAMNPENSDAQ